MFRLQANGHCGWDCDSAPAVAEAGESFPTKSCGFVSFWRPFYNHDGLTLFATGSNNFPPLWEKKVNVPKNLAGRPAARPVPAPAPAAPAPVQTFTR